MRFAPRPADPQRSVATLRSRDEDRQRHAAKPALAASAPHALPAAVRPDAALWSQIGRLAAAIAAREPMLGRLATVPFDATPARIVSAALCHPLAGGDRTRSAAMADVFVETMDEDPAVLEFLEADLKAVVRRDPACRSALHALLHFKGFQALQAHRIAHSLWRRGRCDLAHWLSSQSSLVLGVDIHLRCRSARGWCSTTARQS